MKPIVLTDVLAVGEFPTFEELAILAKAGFKSLINNQPDGEVARFPAAALVAVEAEKLGLAYAHVPIETRTPEPDAIAAFDRAARTLPEPIYAFDYSGARAAAACAFLLAETKEVTEVVADLDRGGFDVRAMAPWLEEARTRRKATAASRESGTAARPEPNGEQRGAGGHASAASGNGDGRAQQAPAAPADAPPPPAALAPAAAIYPRAAGFGGFAL